jgi:hypothetical protein
MPPPGRAQQQRVVEPSMPFTPWPPQEIVNFYYSGLNIECSQEDIVKPTQTFVMQFYGRILEDAWKINSESAAEHRSVYLNMLAYGRVGLSSLDDQATARVGLACLHSLSRSSMTNL